jgi:hypothetical protein
MKPRPSAEERRTATDRRGRDRGGRRRQDWPDDAGITACPACAGATLQNLGVRDTGEYLWFCISCRRRFETKRASRFVL